MKQKIERLWSIVLAVVLAVACSAEPVRSQDPVYTANSIRSLSNPYHAGWNEGGKLFAGSVGLTKTYQVLLYEGDNTRQLDDIKALLAKAGKNVVFNIDPNETANARPIADMLEEAGVYFVTQWNKPTDLHPWDYKYYVAHMQADDVAMGYQTAKAMFEKLSGKGKVLHIQGMLGNSASDGRLNGFKKALAEYPGIEFLEAQSADWDQTKAQQLVENWLIKYPEFNGIHAAGDMHALGAAAAIKSGRPDQLGKILITGCAGDEPTTKAIIAGEVFATAGIDAKWQGGIGLALAYNAMKGKVDLSAEPKEHREFYFDTKLVTAENAQQWLDEVIKGTPTYDWNDPWKFAIGQITY